MAFQQSKRVALVHAAFLCICTLLSSSTFAAEEVVQPSAAHLANPASTAEVPEVTKTMIRKMVKDLRGMLLEVIIVVGHVDKLDAPTEEARQLMSEQRANSVKKYFVELGIEPNRIYTEGKGSKQPISIGETREATEVNRRTDIEVIGINPNKKSDK